MKFHTHITLMLDMGEWSALLFSQFTIEKEPTVPTG